MNWLVAVALASAIGGSDVIDNDGALIASGTLHRRLRRRRRIQHTKNWLTNTGHGCGRSQLRLERIGAGNSFNART